MKILKKILLATFFVLATIFTSCHRENIDIYEKVSFHSASETKIMEIVADCGWTVSKDDASADWLSINPISGTKNDTAIYVTVDEYLENAIRSTTFTVTSSKGNASKQVKVEQNGEYIKVTENILSFFDAAETKTITVTSNCDWTLRKESNDDYTDGFYSVSATSGNVGSTDISISVLDNFTYHNSTGLIRLKSTSGNTETPIRVKQNGRNETNITDTKWGVYTYERWNTDYYGNILDETYTITNYNPFNEEVPGWTMYFLKNNHGVQTDRKYNKESQLVQVLYPFDYEYNHSTGHLHITFESEDPELNEYYDTDVLTLNDTIFIIQDEYRSHFFEKASMRKVGYVIEPDKARQPGKIGTKKRGQPLFDMR